MKFRWRKNSGVGRASSGRAVAAERRQAQAQPCNAAPPSNPQLALSIRRREAALGLIRRHPRPWENCATCWRGSCFWPDCGNDE